MERPNHPILALALVLAVIAAGCLEGGTNDDADDENDPNDMGGDGPTSIPWSLTDCRVVVALIPVTAEAVEAHLPDGFRAGSGADTFGIPPDLRGEAVLGIETFDCAAGSGLNDTREGLAYGAFFTAVHPPEEHAVANAEASLFKWDTLVPDEARRNYLADQGLPVVNGTTDLSGLEVTPAGHTFDVTLDMEGATYRFRGTSAQPADDFRQGFYFVEHTPAHDGLAAWHMPDNEAPDALSGSGVVDLAAGSFPAEVAGADSSQAWFASATTVQFKNGTIALPQTNATTG